MITKATQQFPIKLLDNFAKSHRILWVFFVIVIVIVVFVLLYLYYCAVTIKKFVVAFAAKEDFATVFWQLFNVVFDWKFVFSYAFIWLHYSFSLFFFIFVYFKLFLVIIVSYVCCNCCFAIYLCHQNVPNTETLKPEWANNNNWKETKNQNKGE